MSTIERTPVVAEHFESLERQQHAVRLGMWIFLSSETLLFAGLFALYAAYRADYPADFAAAVHHNNAAIGTANTAILIISSFFVAWSIHGMRLGRRRGCLAGLAAAMVLGATFLGLKTVEYSDHLAEGIAPGVY
ncbi:MAG TPA: cytochrome c oxidase subunit 3, partial [Haliangium sp.]|nr:cytochrome c oxidase subunit 3 [Haliangium sp.]